MEASCLTFELANMYSLYQNRQTDTMKPKTMKTERMLTRRLTTMKVKKYKKKKLRRIRKLKEKTVSR